MLLQPEFFQHTVAEVDWERDILWRLSHCGAGEVDASEKDRVLFRLRFTRQLERKQADFRFQSSDETCEMLMSVQILRPGALRLLLQPWTGAMPAFPRHSPMLIAPLEGLPPELHSGPEEWSVSAAGLSLHGTREGFAWSLRREGTEYTRLQGADNFLSSALNSLPLWFVEHPDGRKHFGCAFNLGLEERIAGSGERFERMDLRGRRYDLVNTDARGTHTNRCYKNIPWLLSSGGYGLFVHSHGKMRFDIGAHSRRSLQILVEDDALDLILIPGTGFEAILDTYRSLTGRPALPPAWTYGMWMSRMSYRSHAEMESVAGRLREENFPCDVLHFDTAWFCEEWVCDWKPDPERFPDPAAFHRRLLERGFRVSYWQLPCISHRSDLWPTASENGFIGRSPPDAPPRWLGDNIDFSSEEATRWYQSLLRPLLESGAAAVKVDFGEDIYEEDAYRGMKGHELRNLYALLYQKAVFEITQEVRGEGIIWARAGWAGSQRYPIHWGGDSEVSWEGMLWSLRGGLHLGLSGFGFWSHDIGGFYGRNGFLEDRPDETLYLRWAQMGAMSSHCRFHGTSPREPWEYPGVAPVVREWLKLRYALLPYLWKESQAVTQSGAPMMRPLVFEDFSDRQCWMADDQFLLGRDILVCPIFNAEGMRSVYLPRGSWVDVWTGETLSGGRWLSEQQWPEARIPLYVREGARIPVSPPGRHTGDWDRNRDVVWCPGRMENGFGPGFADSPLAQWVRL